MLGSYRVQSNESKIKLIQALFGATKTKINVNRSIPISE